MTPAGMRAERVIALLREHVQDVASRHHSERPSFRIDELKQAFKLGMRCGRHDGVIDYARHLDFVFLSDSPVE